MSLIITLLNLIYLIRMYQVCYTFSTLCTTLFLHFSLHFSLHFGTLLVHFSLHFWYTLHYTCTAYMEIALYLWESHYYCMGLPQRTIGNPMTLVGVPLLHGSSTKCYLESHDSCGSPTATTWNFHKRLWESHDSCGSPTTTAWVS
jgi:hypothetical protein